MSSSVEPHTRYIGSLSQWLFGCRHRNVTWPQSRRGDPHRVPYVNCLDCGRRMKYDWKKMSVCADIKGEEV